MKTAMNIALAVLSRRTVTCQEMEKRLRDKKYSAGEINETVSRLISWGYLDDPRLIREYCQTYSRRHSRWRIRKDLLQRGLDKSLIDEVLTNYYSQEEEMELCLRLARQVLERERKQRARPLSEKSYSKVFRDITPLHRTGAKLARLGYPYDMISKALSILANEEIVT
jgi:regulatory protein